MGVLVLLVFVFLLILSCYSDDPKNKKNDNRVEKSVNRLTGLKAMEMYYDSRENDGVDF